MHGNAEQNEREMGAFSFQKIWQVISLRVVRIVTILSYLQDKGEEN